MPRLLLALVLVLSATTANAQKMEETRESRTPFSSQASFHLAPAPSASLGGSTLVLDDGTAENALGLTNGGQFVWFNRFTPPETDFPMDLQSAEVFFGATNGFGVGSQYDVYVYSDPDGNPANGATYVGGATGQAVAQLDAFNLTVFASPLTISTPGDVLILVVNRTNTGAGVFPAAIDESSPSQGRSWLGLYSGASPGNPPVLPAPDMGTADSFGFPGNWLIRGTYTTEPVVGPSLIVSPSTVAFGDVPTGETSTARTVTLTNNGTATVTITSITDSGAPFTVDQTGTDLELDPGENTTLSVTFTPPADGEATGTITIVSNDPDSPQTVNLTGSGFSPPANDDQEDAVEITADGTYTGTNVAATLEPGEPEASCALTPGSASVWWVYTPAENGLLSVDLLASDYDTVLSFHEADGTEIACNEDAPGAPGFQSRLVNVPVAAGEPVFIRVDGYDGEQGNISLDLSFVAGELVTTEIPAGDTSGEPTWNRPLTVGTGTSGSCSLSGTGTAVSYEALPFTVTEGGSYTITTEYASHDGFLYLYQGTFNAADPCLNLVALDDDFNGLGGSQIEGATLTSGDYVLVVTGFANEDAGAYTGDVVGPAAVDFNLVAGESAPDNGQTMLTASPNPVHGAARVRLTVGTAQDVTVAVFDVTGRQVATLFQEAVAAGQSVDLTLDASSLPAGVYVIRASGADVSLTERITVVR